MAKPSSEIKLETPTLEREISDFAHLHIIITSYFHFNVYLVMPKNSSLDPGCAHFGTEQEPAGWSVGSQRMLVSKFHIDLVHQKLGHHIVFAKAKNSSFILSGR